MSLPEPKTILNELVDQGVIEAEVASQLENEGDLSSINIQDLTRTMNERGLITPFQQAKLEMGDMDELLIGEYVVLEKIGEGGMGAVFRARHRIMRREVAIKILPPQLAIHESSVARFMQEVQAAGQLIHPNIVTAYDAGRTEDSVYLVMEYVDGVDISTYLKNTKNADTGGMDPAESIMCTIQAARGLAYAHSKGVIHRDIKPDNLLLSKEGVVKILDMGLAKMDESASDSKVNLTKTDAIMGTAPYMAPEQSMEAKGVDHRADIYSLGCTLFRLLTGKYPYAGETAVATMIMHVQEPIPTLPDDMPAGLQTILEKMLAKSPDDRYQNCHEVIKALESLTGMDQALPQESSSLPQAQTFLRMNKRASLITLSVGIVSLMITLLLVFNRPNHGGLDEPSVGLENQLTENEQDLNQEEALNQGQVNETLTISTPDKEKPEITMPDRPVGRYVKVGLTGRTSLILAEVEVYSGGRNIALKKETSQSFDGKSELVVDGKTDKSKVAKLLGKRTQNPWWVVDLGEAQPIDRVLVWNGAGPLAMNLLKGAEVTILDTNRKPVTSRTLTGPRPMEILDFAASEAEVDETPLAGLSLENLIVYHDFEEVMLNNRVLRGPKRKRKTPDMLQFGAKPAPGRFGQGLDVTHPGRALMYMPRSATMQDMVTISLWAKINSWHLCEGWADLVAFVNEDEPNLRIGIKADGRLHFSRRFAGRSVTAESSIPLPLARWLHITAVDTGSKMQLYLDGSSLGEIARPVRSAKYRPGVLFIGGKHKTSDNDKKVCGGVSGTVDELLIWSSALTEKEVSRLHAYSPEN